MASDRNKWGDLFAYLATVPTVVDQIVVLRAIVTVDPSVISSKAFATWAVTNQHKLAALVAIGRL
jgi:hypothetical protein